MCDQSGDAELGGENLARSNETQNKCMHIILICFSTWNVQQIMFPELIAVDLIANSLLLLQKWEQAILVHGEDTFLTFRTLRFALATLLMFIPSQGS